MLGPVSPVIIVSLVILPATLPAIHCVNSVTELAKVVKAVRLAG